jgi:hypothetical protein
VVNGWSTWSNTVTMKEYARHRMYTAVILGLEARGKLLFLWERSFQYTQCVRLAGCHSYFARDKED